MNYEQIQQQRKNAVAGKVDGQRKYGKVSDDLIELLKRIETPKPDKDGKIGLHMPGDGVLDEYNTDSGPLMNKIDYFSRIAKKKRSRGKSLYRRRL